LLWSPGPTGLGTGGDWGGVLSAHVLAVDPDQLPAQLAGRTIGRREPALARLHAAARAWSHAAWLCPVLPTLAQPGGALRQTLTGHGSVVSVAVSADGRTAVSGGWDHTVRVWDLTGRRRRPRVLTGHDDEVEAVAVSADGGTAVSCGHDGTVRAWDLAGTAARRVLTGHDGWVGGVAVSADGRTAVSGGTDYTVRVWDLAGDQEQARWIADAEVLAVAFNTAITVVGDADGQVHALQLNVPAAASA
jgi:WD40 repeat protein